MIWLNRGSDPEHVHHLLTFDPLPPGPGIGPTIAIGQEVGFVVNTKGAGKGKVQCVVVTPDGSEVEAEVMENEDGTFDIFYTAPTPGNYVIYVRFGGENIPKSPFRVMVRNHTCAFLRYLKRISILSLKCAYRPEVFVCSQRVSVFCCRSEEHTSELQSR